MKLKCMIVAFIATLFILSCKKQERPQPIYAGSPYDPYRYGYPYGSPYYPYPNNYPDTNRFALPYTAWNVNGYVKYYYLNTGIILSEGNYEAGRPSGYWKIFYPNGRMMREGNYSNGILSGYWKFYYDNGFMKEEGNYSNNIKSGTWKYYYPNGIKYWEVSY